MRRLWRAYVRAGAIKESALRGLMPSRMHFVHYSWPLRPGVCPCDVHFCDYLQERNIRRKSVFHFGTGGHHLVGTTNRDAGLENEILGLTVSPAEHARYVARVVRDPALGRHYKVLFADIYSLSAASLPAFDLVTLFHLSEFADSHNAGTRLDDGDVLRLFCSKLTPGGLLFLYPGSYGYARAAPLVAQAVEAGAISFLEDFKSLIVFRVPQEAGTVAGPGPAAGTSLAAGTGLAAGITPV